MNKSKFSNLRQEVEEKKSVTNKNTVLPKKIPNDKRKNFTFTLTELERKRLSELSQAQGYKSDSKFLGDLIMQLSEEEQM